MQSVFVYKSSFVVLMPQGRAQGMDSMPVWVGEIWGGRVNQVDRQGRTDAGLLLTSSCMQVCAYLKKNGSKKFLLSSGHRHSFQVPVFLRRAKPAVKPFGPFNRFCCEAVLRSSEMGALRRSCVSS